MIKQAKTVNIPTGGGINTISSPISIKDDQSPNCKNVHSNLTKTLERRSGHTSASSAAASGTTGNGLFDYWKNSTTHYMIAYMDTSLYKMDPVANVFDGTLDAITFATAMSNDVMEFETFNDGGTNYLIMATHSRDTLQKWDGTTCTDLSSDANMPKPKYLKVWKNRLFCANIASHESRVSYNDVAGAIVDATDWTNGEYYDVLTYDGDFITGMALLKGKLYAFKRYSIHRFTYYGGTPLFEVKQVISGTGTISSKSIANISHPTMGEILVFLGADARFYAFDGLQIYPISVNIENDNRSSEFNLTRLNKIYLSSSCAVNHELRHWYVCWVPTATYNNWAVVWDYYNDSWWPFTGMDARCCGTAEDSGERRTYFIEDSGKVHRFDNGNTDDGNAITAIYDTKKISSGDKALIKKNRHLDLQLKNTGNYVLGFRRRSNWDTSWSTTQNLSLNGGGFILGTSLLGTGKLGGGEAVTQTVEIPTTSEFEQFRFSTSSTNPPWRIDGIDLVTEGLGQGGVGT